MKVTISAENQKMGPIPSVSLPAVKTCAPGFLCAGKCYARRFRKSAMEAYERNLMAYYSDPLGYFDAIAERANLHRFFRWHVSGDIVEPLYLYDMVGVARRCPATTFLAFTKRYDIVNDFLDSGHQIPENLRIVFSEWPGMPMPNPHGLPVAHFVPRGSLPDPEWIGCGGTCSECASVSGGCWTMRPGDHLYFGER